MVVTIPAVNRNPAPLPTFLVVGAAKAGTTSLYNRLNAHPQVYMSPIKEPSFFGSDIDPDDFAPDYRGSYFMDYRRYVRGDMSRHVHISYVRDWDAYCALFRKADSELAIGEISNAYLFSTRAAEEIRSRLPHEKIVIVLRNPVDRALSQYLMDLRLGYVKRPFWEELADDLRRPRKGWGVSRLYIEGGLYYEQVRRYLAVFPKDQVRIFLADDLWNKSATTLSEFYRFIGVNGDSGSLTLGVDNRGKVPRFPYLNYRLHSWGIKRRLQEHVSPVLLRPFRGLYYLDGATARLTPEARKQLLGYFRDDLIKLQNLISRDLSHWLG